MLFTRSPSETLQDSSNLVITDKGAKCGVESLEGAVFAASTLMKFEDKFVF